MKLRTRRFPWRRASVVLGVVLVGLGLSGQRKAARAQALSFPADEGWHEGADFEMWSLLAHLETESGRPLGVGVMFFSGKIVGLDVSGTFHLVADEAEREWSSNRDLVLPVFGRKRHTAGRLDEAYDRSRIWREPGSGEIRVQIRSGGTDLELSFEPTLEAVDFGSVPVGDDAHQRIYARPRGRVSGEISRDTGPAESLRGTGVLQHAWGDSPEPARTGNFYSAHLDDGSAVVAYHGDEQGAAHALSVTRPGGSPVVIRTFTADAARSVVGGNEDVVYPLEWDLLATGPGPDRSVNLHFDPTTGGQPVRVLGMPFWVGRCRVTGTLEGTDATGSGYVLIRGRMESASNPGPSG